MKPNADRRRSSGSDLDTQTVMLIVTEACNLQCVYCYEKNKTPRKMTESMIKDIITKHMTQQAFTNVSFDFFGGEPLLEFDTIRNVVEWFHTRRWSKGHRFTASTNGTLFTDEMKRWFTEWRECVIPMLSLDGTKKAHDTNRCNSYDKVVAHTPFFKANWPTQPTKMTVSPYTIDQIAEGVMNIHSLGLLVEVSVVFENVWGDTETKQRYLKMYEGELAALVDFYDANPDLPVPLILSRNISALLVKTTPGTRYCGAGKYMVCYTPDGVSYPCHRFTPLSSTNPNVDPYSAQVNCVPEGQECNDCMLLPICPTCQGFNWETNCHTDARTTYHCDFFKLEVLASAKLLIRRIKAQLDNEDLSAERVVDLTRQILGIHKLISSGIYESVFKKG